MCLSRSFTTRWCSILSSADRSRSLEEGKRGERAKEERGEDVGQEMREGMIHSGECGDSITISSFMV